MIYGTIHWTFRQWKTSVVDHCTDLQPTPMKLITHFRNIMTNIEERRVQITLWKDQISSNGTPDLTVWTIHTFMVKRDLFGIPLSWHSQPITSFIRNVVETLPTPTTAEKVTTESIVQDSNKTCPKLNTDVFVYKSIVSTHAQNY